MNTERILTFTIFLVYLVAAILGFTGFGLLGAQWGAGESFLTAIPGFVVIALRLFITLFTLVNLAVFHGDL